MSTTVDSTITTTNAIDAYGNQYTTAVSGNDQLANEDFITLMLTELQYQDPTKPVDSSSMLDDQLSLQTLETNISLTESMESLSTSFEQSALADSVSLIGNIVENGDLNDDGTQKQYKVSSVEGQDGTIYLTAYEITGYYDIYAFEEVDSASSSLNSINEDDIFTITDSSGTIHEISTYGKTYEDLATELDAIDGVSASMLENTNGKYQLSITVNNSASTIASNGVDFAYSKDNATLYAEESQALLFSDISKIY